MKIKTWWN